MSPNIGHAELLLGQFEKAQDTLTRILAIAREKGFQGDSAWASAYLALTEQYLGHYDQAAQHAREAHALGLHTAYSYAVLSTLAILRDDPCEAIQWAQRATYPGRAVVKPLQAALLYSNLACGAQSTAQLEAARRLHAAILPPPWTVPHRLAIWLPPAAVLLAGLGDPALAVEAYALAQTHPMAANSQFHRNLYGPRIHEAAASLGIEAAEAARARGRSREAEAMIADVMAVLGRATEDADLGTLVEGLLATLDARP
jgi:hypothetical protein